jgi:phage tail sheath protein FI
MAFSYKTPGVYLEEIVKLPPSVASVETAIPCFFGVTQKATELIDKDLVGVAKKINSLADYEFFFGMPDVAKAEVLVKLNVAAEAKLSNAYVNNLYYAVKHYFDNGGGPCYIHSIGDFARTGVDVDTYKNELTKLDLVDEVTIILLPDLAALNNKDQFYDVYNNALQKASSLQDKFVVIDVNSKKTGTKVNPTQSKAEFRDTISNNIDAIKYGAAYFPNLETTYSFDFNTANIKMTFAQDVMDANESSNLLNNINYNTAKQIFSINSMLGFLNDDYFKNISTETYANKISEINSKRNLILPSFNTAEQQTLIDNAKRLKCRLMLPLPPRRPSLILQTRQQKRRKIS